MIRTLGNRKIKDFKGREQLEIELRQMIQKNELDCNHPITTEMELAKVYGISRNTVRKALQALTDEGLLYKRHGLGTFVVPQENRSPERTVLNKILLFMPSYVGDVNRLDLYDRQLISGITDYTFLHHGQLELRKYGESSGKLLDQYRNLKFDGIIWERPMLESYPVIEALARFKIPQVTISRQLDGVSSLFFDYQAGIRKVLRFLRGIGHRRIVFIDLESPEPIFVDRRRVFEEDMRGSGILKAEDYIYQMPSKGVTAERLDRVFQEHPDITAIFCSAALIRGLWEQLQRRNCRIPQDLSLLTLSENMELLKSDEIGSLCEPRREIGLRAVNLIKLMKTTGSVPCEPEFLTGELVVRKSCLSPRHILKEQII